MGLLEALYKEAVRLSFGRKASKLVVNADSGDAEASSIDTCCTGPALIALAALGRVNEVNELLAAGVCVNTPDSRGYTALISAARYNEVDVVTVLLAARANVESETHFGWTPLVMCARKGNTESARLLIEARADVSRRWRGASLASIANAKGHVALADIFAD